MAELIPTLSNFIQRIPDLLKSTPEVEERKKAELAKLVPGTEAFLDGYKEDLKDDGKINGSDLFIKYQPTIDMREALDRVYPGYAKDIKDGKADANDILDAFLARKGIKETDIPDINKVKKQLETIGLERQRQVFTFIGKPPEKLEATDGEKQVPPAKKD